MKSAAAQQEQSAAAGLADAVAQQTMEHARGLVRYQLLADVAKRIMVERLRLNNGNGPAAAPLAWADAELFVGAMPEDVLEGLAAIEAIGLLDGDDQ